MASLVCGAGVVECFLIYAELESAGTFIRIEIRYCRLGFWESF